MATHHRHQPPAQVKVEHLINAMYQIERWCRTVREVLSCMDPCQTIDTCREVNVAQVKNNIWDWECPPPDGPECEDGDKTGTK